MALTYQNQTGVFKELKTHGHIPAGSFIEIDKYGFAIPASSPDKLIGVVHQIDSRKNTVTIRIDDPISNFSYSPKLRKIVTRCTRCKEIIGEHYGYHEVLDENNDRCLCKRCYQLHKLKE